ncbi:MAG TPA: KpsF/GutQ family sugar-phosphate isomerase [Candidatus Bathyarchaeia archaeon]|nr:KpsF/GutQ family sugar-phosphate isomerase [Candidatus Bathyarchaeia archaeon]
MSLSCAKELILTEAAAIKDLAKKLDQNFLKALDMIAGCRGRLIISGMGKTGIIGRKIAATLSSTGTPTIWMHSAEAVHGDLGQVTRDDVVMVISTSGETEETVRLAPLLKKIGTQIIAMTGNVHSSLAQSADVVLDVGVEKEGCPLGVAPMASTTATLVMGDALAACLIVRKNFCKEDFAFFHPGGALGRQLYLKVEDIMRKDAGYACVGETTVVRDVLLAITKARCGSACVVDAKGKLVGILTDGDIRRHLGEDEQFLSRPVKAAMTATPSTISQDRLAVEAFQMLKAKKIDELPVVDAKGHSVGLLDVQDLLRAGLF